MSESNINNFQILIDKKRIVKKMVDNALLAFGVPHKKAVSDYRAAGIEYKDLVKQIASEIGGGGGSTPHPLKAGDTRLLSWQSTLDYGGSFWTQITFATPFADNQYSPNVIATFKDPTKIWTIAEVLPTGFRIVSNDGYAAPNDTVYWGATKHGEYQDL